MKVYLQILQVFPRVRDCYMLVQPELHKYFRTCHPEKSSESQNHRLTDLFMLEKVSESIASNLRQNTSLST